ncbi:MAG TPA: hypothetical protein ENI23_09985 [bacterium]|nr:hypothetical protein [bacterium]
MLKQLQTHHKEIARLKVLGYTPAEIAEKTGAKLQTVYANLRDPICQSFMSGLSDKLDKEVISTRKRLIDLNNDSLDVITDILSKDSKAPFSVQLTAARDNLDRTGYKVPEVVEVNHSFLTSKDIEELNENSKDVNTDYLNE